jgi:hypothetical protein
MFSGLLPKPSRDKDGSNRYAGKKLAQYRPAEWLLPYDHGDFGTSRFDSYVKI